MYVCMSNIITKLKTFVFIDTADLNYLQETQQLTLLSYPMTTKDDFMYEKLPQTKFRC